MTQAEMELARRLVLLLAKDEEMELLLVALEKAEKSVNQINELGRLRNSGKLDILCGVKA